MKTATHGNGNGLDDLLVLPETEEERKAVLLLAKSRGRHVTSSISNVEGQDWYGKQFIEILFSEDLMAEVDAIAQPAP